jgi:hypothetical protein
MSGGYPGNQEVEKSGGAPVEEGPATTPDEVLSQDEGGKEQRPDSDQAGHEPDEHRAG